MSDIENYNDSFFPSYNAKENDPYDEIVNHIDKINAAIAQFDAQYEHNNIHGLFKTSADFYQNIINYIKFSEKEIKEKPIYGNRNATHILNSIIEIKNIIPVIKKKGHDFIQTSTLKANPDFTGSLISGYSKFSKLENKTKSFINSFQRKVQMEKEEKIYQQTKSFTIRYR